MSTTQDISHNRRHAHKFGGSSVADAHCIQQVATLLQQAATAGYESIVVVSALQGTTDALIALTDAAIAKAPDWRAALAQLCQRHRDTLQVLDYGTQDTINNPSFPRRRESSEINALDDQLALLKSTSRGNDNVEPNRRVSNSQQSDWFEQEFSALALQLESLGNSPVTDSCLRLEIQGLGEVWSSRLVQLALGGEAAGWARLDARDVLIVKHNELGAHVDWDESRARLAQWRENHSEKNVVITGFVARDHHGAATTLGRNGSDYSGAIFANLFNCAQLSIWTDVDGVLSADPRLVPDAVTVPRMSYAEACELAYFGAKVIHPQTLAPAMQQQMPICIRNTFNPTHEGTRISADAFLSTTPVKGLSLIQDLAILEVTGAGMIGVPGTAERVFSALHTATVSVVMITQGSSEHSICCVIRESEMTLAVDVVRVAFLEEIAAGQIQRIAATGDISVLAAIGDGMVGTPGIAATLMAGLARARVNIRAIAQGASERNISIAVTRAEATRALRAAHTALWLSPQTISIGLIGLGNVGSALLRQLAEAIPRLREEKNLHLQLRAIANSRHMRLCQRELEAHTLLAPLNATDSEFNLAAFLAHVQTEHLPHSVIIDCSGSNSIVDHYADWLARGIHVVTPGKHAGSGAIERYQQIRRACESGARFRFEATVGAGLPIIQTLRSLLDTGDELHSIEGMLSGTLAWLFNAYDGTRPFSALVREAHALGYTEPDPRDDLGGLDVARKLVILAREAGWKLSLDQVQVESLVPIDMMELSRDNFLNQLEQLDAPMAQRLAAAQEKNQHLRYIAHLDRSGTAVVELKALPAEHACCHTRLTDNLVQFRTNRYANNPLIVQGPGAGPEVTAAGVFGDLLQIAFSVGAKL